MIRQWLLFEAEVELEVVKPRQAVGQFKAAVAQRAIGAKGWPAQRRFVDQVQGQARSQGFIGQFTRPGSQQIPGAQAKVLGREQPQAQEVARNLIGQELPDLPLQAWGVGALQAHLLSGALCGQNWRRVFGVEAVEFFFERRNRR